MYSADPQFIHQQGVQFCFLILNSDEPKHEIMYQSIELIYILINNLYITIYSPLLRSCLLCDPYLFRIILFSSNILFVFSRLISSILKHKYWYLCIIHHILSISILKWFLYEIIKSFQLTSCFLEGGKETDWQHFLDLYVRELCRHILASYNIHIFSLWHVC